MNRIRLALVGIGNCASSLVQGVAYYRETGSVQGLINERIGPYRVQDVEFVLGFDVDSRKVGLDLSEAIFAAPNNTRDVFRAVPHAGVPVRMGRVADGVAPHMLEAGERGFQLADAAEPTKADVVAALRAADVHILVNFLPVGSQEASEFYMECALEAGVAVVNCIPVFIASDPVWAERFRAARIPIIGDDIKAQVGATILHRVLSELFVARGVSVDRTYQLNTGGNTDFMNMLDRSRIDSKRTSKTEAVQSVLADRLADENIRVGPSEYVPWQKDNKLCFLRIEGENWGGSPVNIEVRLSVEDSPNSAACVLDAVRCARLALDRGEGGPQLAPSASYCKHPPEQFDEAAARVLLADYLAQQPVAELAVVASPAAAIG